MCPTPDDGRDSEEQSMPTSETESSAGDGSALSPDDLDIAEDENVVRLDEGRFVIGTDERPDVPANAENREPGGGQARASNDGGASGERATASEEGAAGAGESGAGDGATPSAPGGVDSPAVKQWLEADLRETNARYGFHVAAKSEEAVSHQQLFSDDVGTVFDGLLRWYAQQLTTETAVEDVLGILLTESNVRVRYSPSCLQAVLEAYDLGPDDTIADLFEAVRDDRGMVFPPENV